MTQKKIGRNDPCWCGSGKKYKKCHANRSEEAPYEYHEMANELIRLRAGEKTCLYPVPGAGPCAAPVIKAHSISRSAALSKISGDGHVYQPDSNPYNLLKQEGIRYRLRGINEATTFTGFCAPHDSSLFVSVDTKDLVPTHEQLFFLHYRALCREFYVKRPTLPSNEVLRNLDRGKPLAMQHFVQGLVNARSEAIEVAIKDLDAEKTVCDNAIVVADLSAIAGCALRFAETPTFACSGLTQPVYDFAGQTLQNLLDLDKPAFNMSFTLLACDTGGVAAFAWSKAADAVCRKFVNSLLSVPDSRKTDALIQLIFDTFENHAIEPNFWDNLPADTKSEAERRMLNWTDIQTDPTVRRDALIPGTTKFADWQIRAVQWLP